MILISNKAKQFLVFTIKVLIVVGAFYFIYDQLAHNDKLDWVKFTELLRQKQAVSGILFLFSFSVANRFLEILKWQNLVTTLQPITIGEATKQVLSALTAGIFTPNGIGEYAGKALYFKKSKAKKIVFLNLICNGIQMLLTVLFGTLGLFLIGYWLWALGIIAVSLFIILLSIVSKKVTIKGHSFEKLLVKINEIPKAIHNKNNLLAVSRYLIFSHQYYFLFVIFGVDLPYFTLIGLIATVYFLASALPTFQFLDFAVKGSIAVFFFSKYGVNEWIIIFASTLMWFLNVVLPVIIGSYFVLKFKPKWN